MTTQIAVKLPDELVAQLDKLVTAGVYANRSQAVRFGLESVVAGHVRRELDRSYREAFGKLPETPEDLAAAERLAVESIHDEPWERWW